MFTLEVEFLLGRCFSSKYDDPTQPEWPPNPARLFSALAAAYFEGGEDIGERMALEWLERCGAPSITFGEPGVSNPVQVFVPTNYPGDHAPHLRGKQPRYLPAQSPSEARVYFVWPQAGPDPQILGALRGLASRTGALGRASSLVQVTISDQTAVPTYEPSPDGEVLMQVPYPGRLDDLATLYKQNRRPTPGKMERYREAGKTVETKVTSGFFENVVFLEKVSGPSLPIEATLTVTDAFRNALLKQSGDLGEIPELLHGHNKTVPHCALLAPPFVDRKFADGRLMGLGIAFPRSASGEDRRRVLMAVAKVVDSGLNISKDIGSWGLEPVEFMTAPETLRSRTWVQDSHEWVSATPVLLDRFPKEKGPSVEEILSLACERVGLPAPEVLQYSPWPILPGSAPVTKHRLHRGGEAKPKVGVHVRLRFPVSVRGPILLGAGRFFGLGLMRPQFGRGVVAE